MFFVGAWGYLQLLKLPVPPGQSSTLPAGGGSLLSNSTALLALAALVVTAVLIGVLAVIRWISPLATGLPGALLLAWTALYLVSVRSAVDLIPLRSQAFGAGWEGLLFNGILGSAGVVMVFPLFFPSRWRGPRRSETDTFSRDVDDYLAAVRTDPKHRRGTEKDWEPEPEPLVGTLVGGRPTADEVRPVDTTRITGASRALRNTGSFRVATGAQPRAGGGQPRGTGPRPRGTGSMPRATGSMPRATGWPYE
ncbi:MAG TPA: hypothetical protein VIZ43_03210 [Trebonia sp.]